MFGIDRDRLLGTLLKNTELLTQLKAKNKEGDLCFPWTQLAQDPQRGSKGQRRKPVCYRVVVPA